jgi:hypothetical protein
MVDEGSIGEERLARLAWVAAALLLAVLAWPVFQGRVYADSDLGNLHLPLRQFYARCLASGTSFAWCPDIYGGVYLHGEGEAGMLHPFHWLIYRFLPLWLAFDVEILASYVFLFLGTRSFLLVHTARHDAAAFGALVMTLSAGPLLHFVHPNMVAVFAHVPWLLRAIHVSLTSSEPRRIATARLGLSVLTASELLLGFPQCTWFSVFLESLYVLFLARSSSASAILGLGVAKAFGVLGGAAQVLPTLDSLASSTRAAVDAGWPYQFSLHPIQLAQLVAPYAFEGRALHRTVAGPYDYGIYGGAASLVLWTWLLVRWRTLENRRLVAASLLLAGLGVFLSFGKEGLVYRAIAALPVVGRLRAPCRYILFFELATSVASALAFMDLARQRAPMPWRAMRPLLAALVASVAVSAGALALRGLAPTSVLGAHIDRSTVAIALGPLTFAVATALVALAARGSRVALGGLVILVAIDQGSYGLSFALASRQVPLGEVATSDQLPQAPPGTRLRLNLHSNRPLLRRFRLDDGFLGLVPRRWLPDSETAHRVASVAWVGSADTTDYFYTKDMTWNPVAASLPRARLVARALESSDPATDIEKIDVATTALVNRPACLVDGSPGTATIVSDLPGRLVVVCRASTRQLLVVSESYHPEWHAMVRSVPVPVLRAYGDFLGVVVEPGETTVDLMFDPASLRAGIFLSEVAGVLVLLFWIAGAARPRRAAGAVTTTP